VLHDFRNAGVNMCGMSTIKVCLLFVTILVVLIAIGIGLGREYINLTPKQGGFKLKESVSARDFSLEGISNVLLVGGTNGIGLALAEELVRNGVRVTVVGRTEPKNLTKNSKARFVKTDVASIKAARNLVHSLKDDKFDVLFFTVGISPMKFELTPEGIESDLAVSYLSRHVIVQEFLKRGFGNSESNSSPKKK